MPLPRGAATAQAIEAYVQRPSHAILLAGPTGVGKGSVAQEIARVVLGDDRAISHPDVVLAIDAPTIGIDNVREITQFVRLKSTHGGDINRVVIVEHAEHMTPEAQNALLKILEEPPADTIIILTAAAPVLLLPTIVSRLQVIDIVAADQAALTAYFKSEGHAADAVSKAYNLSGGLPGLMSSILAAEGGHPLLLAAQSARTVLQGTAFDRLCMVDSLSKQRELAIDLCEMLGRMASLSLRNDKLSTTTQQKWRHILMKSHEAAQDLRQFTQAKLVLTKLFLEI